jgi:hypothetical protein
MMTPQLSEFGVPGKPELTFGLLGCLDDPLYGSF